MNKEDRSPERVVCAAYVMKDGFIVSGVRHLSPDMRATMERIYGEGYWEKISRENHHIEGGFINQFGEYLTREEAWVIAVERGQIFREVSSPGALYSECLY